MPSASPTSAPEGSVAAVLAAASARLETASDEPAREAELLLLEALNCRRSRLYAEPEAVLGSGEQARFEALLARRAAGEPLAYITGHQPFWSLDLAVTPAVLIPRPETELLVEAGLSRLEDTVGMRALDLGTGSGAIALSLKRERRTWDVYASDRDAAALDVARGNAARNGLEITLLQGDWYEPVAGQRFDLIVCNPPYVAAGDPHLRALGHEPQGALVGGPDGLDALRQVIAGAPDHLLNAGWLLVEHGYDQAAAVRALLREAGMREVHSRRDLLGHERVSGGRTPA